MDEFNPSSRNMVLLNDRANFWLIPCRAVGYVADDGRARSAATHPTRSKIC